MKHIILIILSVLALAGCRDQSEQERQPEQQTARQFEEERQQRVVAERHAEESEEKSNRWQFAASVLGIAACVLLVIGTSLGSAAKKNAKPRN